MRIRLTATAVMATALLAIAATPSLANTFFQRAPGDAAEPTAGTADTACVVPAGPGGPYASQYVHCHDPAAIRSWYGVDKLPNKGEGQTIVLVDSYGTPTGAHDLQVFHDRFFPNEPHPNYTQVCKNNCRPTAPPTPTASPVRRPRRTGPARRRSTSSGPTRSRRTRTSCCSPCRRPRR